MSAQYKVKKYISKLEKESSPSKIDLYMSKIRKYKLAQSGGTAWTDAVEQARTKIVGYSSPLVNDTQEKIIAISEAYERNTTSLKDALAELDKLVKEINKLNQVPISEKLQDAINRNTEETGNSIWDGLQNQSAPAPASTPAPAPEQEQVQEQDEQQ